MVRAEGDRPPPAVTAVEDFMELYIHCPVHPHGVVLNLAEEKLYIGCVCEGFA